MKIKAMTYNIHHGRGVDGKLDLDRIIQVIRESKADIVGLNEVDRHFAKRSAYLDQVSYIAERLQMHQAFGAAFTLGWNKSTNTNAKRAYGNAILSRYPITIRHNHLFDFYAGVIEGRALLETVIQINPDQQLKVYLTHLSLNPLLHKKQTDYFLKRVASEQLPILVLGDWNMKPKARAWRKVTKQLIDVCTVAGDTDSFLTFPSLSPRSQLDYIFVSHDLHMGSVEVVDLNPIASDHLPLTATLHLKS